MGDKTQLLTLLLASRTKKHIFLFFSIMAGFLVGVTLATIFGASISSIIPHKILSLITGILFVILGIVIFIDGREKSVSKKLRIKHQFFSIALLIFLTDFGDKTQIAIALLSTDYHPILVFLAAILALGLDTVLMIFFSKAILKKFPEKTIKKIAGLIFAIIGIYILFTGI